MSVVLTIACVVVFGLGVAFVATLLWQIKHDDWSWWA